MYQKLTVQRMNRGEGRVVHPIWTNANWTEGSFLTPFRPQSKSRCEYYQIGSKAWDWINYQYWRGHCSKVCSEFAPSSIQGLLSNWSAGFIPNNMYGRCNICQYFISLRLFSKWTVVREEGSIGWTPLLFLFLKLHPCLD